MNKRSGHFHFETAPFIIFGSLLIMVGMGFLIHADAWYWIALGGFLTIGTTAFLLLLFTWLARMNQQWYANFNEMVRNERERIENDPNTTLAVKIESDYVESFMREYPEADRIDFEGYSKVFIIVDKVEAFVGGYIQEIVLPDGRSLFMDEDGKLKEKLYNEYATGLARMAGIANDDFVVGRCILCEQHELEKE